MHDFAASHTHSVLLDLPLSLNPLNLLQNTPVVSFSPSTPSRFGILPRHEPAAVQWFSSTPCIIFHTAYAFNTSNVSTETFNLVCCRLNSSRLIYAAGNLPSPPSQLLPAGNEDTCLLFYYQFALSPNHDPHHELPPTHAFPLSAIPFEFPVVAPEHSMTSGQFVYGCSMQQGTFSAALGKAAKIDCLVKIDSRALIAAGIKGRYGENDPVDARSVSEILASQARHTEKHGEGPDGPITIFTLPDNVFAQEPSFVPRAGGTSEDDGWLLTYVFDEAQLDSEGEPRPDSKSELWVLDAKDMSTVVAKVLLPQRVPYGLHGHWFTKAQVESQRESSEIRSPNKVLHTKLKDDWAGSALTPYTLMVSEEMWDEKTEETFWHSCLIVSQDMDGDSDRTDPLLFLQQMIKLRVPDLKTLIAVSLSRSLTAPNFSCTFRIEFGARAIEVEVEPLFSDVTETLEQGVREVMNSITQITDPAAEEKRRAARRGKSSLLQVESTEGSANASNFGIV
ncbi:hypothetical protein RQP46_008523 [Phenoliferia psychrophenolica]